jgi:hypothetical protein
MSDQPCPVFEAYKAVNAAAKAFRDKMVEFIQHPDANAIFAIAQAHGYRSSLPDINPALTAIDAALKVASDAELTAAAAQTDAKTPALAEVTPLPKQ